MDRDSKVMLTGFHVAAVASAFLFGATGSFVFLAACVIAVALHLGIIWVGMR